MKHHRHAIRASTVAAVCLAVALFVHLHGTLQANWLHHGCRLPLTALPLPTAFYHDYAVLGYLLPLAALSALLVPRDESGGMSMRAEAFLMIVGLVALLWLLGGILAWQLPLYHPVVAVE